MSLKNKKGFGIVEVLVSALVLGFLLVALLNLQVGNREALLRIRGRDGAVDVAQKVLDSLQQKGVAYLETAKNENNIIVFENLQRSWVGQPGVVAHTMTINYRAEILVSNDDSHHEVSPESQYITATNTSTVRVYAKDVLVKVYWKYKDTEQSIQVSGVIK
ncbi:MAG: prepilin-type N-terminal cleavage/methylation domain-containing protein [Fibrobacteraceae bacterium]|nr:prepilin-type N-terminal cleavage/methylation domain-containing protein [Fibrobacteraceae bacterium]